MDTTIQIGRNLSGNRVSAYECEILPSKALVQHKYVRGWYGIFSVDRLKDEIMPKLHEYIGNGYSYPFLITSHMLQNKTTAFIDAPQLKKAKASDVKFSRRKQCTPSTQHAVIFSSTDFMLLSPD
jgi:hypothetical protein